MESRQRQRYRRTSPSRFFLLCCCSLGLLVGCSSVAMATAASEVDSTLMEGHIIGPMGIVHMARRAAEEQQNYQQFTGSLGAAPPAVTSTGDSARPFGVGGDTFTNFQDAGQRSCNMQFTTCQQEANSNKSVGFTVKNCQSQQSDCLKAQQSAQVKVQASAAPSSSSSSSSSSETASTSTSTSTGTTTAASTSISSSSTSTSSNTSITATDTITSSGTSTSTAAVAQTTIFEDQFVLICDLQVGGHARA